MRRWSVILALALAACAADPTPPPVTGPAETTVPLGAEFTLQLGQRVRLGDTGDALEFQAVLEDGRCPEDVRCVWQGNARTRLVLRGAGEAVPVVLNTGVEPFATDVLGYRVELLDLNPPRRSDRPVHEAEYRARLRVSRP